MPLNISIAQSFFSSYQGFVSITRDVTHPHELRFFALMRDVSPDFVTNVVLRRFLKRFGNKVSNVSVNADTFLRNGLTYTAYSIFFTLTEDKQTNATTA